MTCAVMVSAANAGRSICVTPQPAAKAAAIDTVATMRFMDNPPCLQFFVSGCYAAERPMTRPAKIASQEPRAALSCCQLDAWRKYENDFGQTRRHVFRAGADVRSCRGANQDH